MREDASTHAGYAAAVVAATLDALLAAPRPALVGLSGLQGSGKSTIARELRAAAQRRGVHLEILALDDFYFGRRERARLARRVHPLLATRGVPGTHDLDLLEHTLDALAHASAQRPVAIPRFDKGRDTRLPPSRWRRVDAPPQQILLEGWCVGVPPQRAAALVRPQNALERDEDRDRRWRRFVNAQLAGRYAALWRRLDRLVLLEAPSFALVARWREQQERALDAAALQRFLMHYERLSRHALRELPQRADLRLVLGPEREVRAMRAKG